VFSFDSEIEVVVEDIRDDEDDDDNDDDDDDDFLSDAGDDKDNDDVFDIGKKSRWAEMLPNTKAKACRALFPLLSSLLKSRVHENAHDDIPSILLYIAETAIKREKRVVDKGSEMEILANTSVVKELALSYVAAPLNPKKESKILDQEINRVNGANTIDTRGKVKGPELKQI
jgi:hypothetical protein